MNKLLPLFLLVFCAAAYGQATEIGKLVDPNGEPIRMKADERFVYALLGDDAVSDLFSYRVDSVRTIAPGVHSVALVDQDLTGTGDFGIASYELRCDSDTFRVTGFKKFTKTKKDPVLDRPTPDAAFMTAERFSPSAQLLKSVCTEFHKK